MIEFKQISLKYGEKSILKQFDASVEEGQIVCVVGPSGTGKTTLFRIMMGLVVPDSGEIRGISGKSISTVFQENRLCENLSAANNVALVLHGKDRMKRAVKALSIVLPGENYNVPVRNYSGGMKRRVAIARAVTAESDILLLDEPFTGLDQDSMKQTMDYIISNKGERTIFVIAHNEAEMEAMHPDLFIKIETES